MKIYKSIQHNIRLFFRYLQPKTRKTGMCKRVFAIFLLIVPAFIVSAQNIQLHYDFRHTLSENSESDFAGKNFLLTTVEMFRPDRRGSTFFFVDMTYAGKKGGINSAYWEIARDLKFWKAPVAVHLEYNGGVASTSIPNAYLAGVSWTLSLAKIKLNTYLAYKCNAFEKTSHDVQWTVVWHYDTPRKYFTICGYMDLWTENKDFSGNRGGKRTVVMSQPQFWFNAAKHFSAGSEIGINYNFYGDKVFVLPTVAVKWTF